MCHFNVDKNRDTLHLDRSEVGEMGLSAGVALDYSGADAEHNMYLIFICLTKDSQPC